jgi:hypothetical protein
VIPICKVRTARQLEQQRIYQKRYEDKKKKKSQSVKRVPCPVQQEPDPGRAIAETSGDQVIKGSMPVL